MRDRCFNGELFPISPQTAQRAERAHAPRRDSHLAELFDVTAMNIAISRGNESVERTAERLSSGAAKHALGGWAEKHDALLGIYRDNSIHVGVDQFRHT